MGQFMTDLLSGETPVLYVCLSPSRDPMSTLLSGLVRIHSSHWQIYLVVQADIHSNLG